jgi:MFS family permease
VFAVPRSTLTGMALPAARASAAAPSSWRAVLTGASGWLTIGLTLITLTVATESLIITAIMPAIVRDIGGISYYGLAFSAFFLAGLASIPTAGWAADRYGPALPFLVLITVFLAGSLVAAFAPSMPVLVLGRLAQGYGAASQFTLSQSVIARAYRDAARVKVLSLMSATWTLPGLVGPSVGAVIASTFGWRWAFGIVVAPALAACLITYPRLRALRPSGASPRAAPIRWPLQVAAGAGLVIGGLTAGAWWGTLLILAGLPVTVIALRHTLPAGSLRARAGLPAIVAAGFLLNVAFYSASSFVPLALTRVRGTSIAEAGLAVSAATVAWTVGVWTNTQLVGRVPRGRLIATAALVLAAGIAGFGAALYGFPLPLAYAAWVLAGFGMGIAFNTFTLNAMALAPKGEEGRALAGRNLSANLGTAAGTGIGGAALGLSTGAQLGLRPGLTFIYALAGASAVATASLAGRASPLGVGRAAADVGSVELPVEGNTPEGKRGPTMGGSTRP